MNTTLLQYFKTLANSGNYSAAAAQLRITEAALSSGIEHLENEVGTKLLEQRRGKIILTPAGSQFLHEMEPLAVRYQGALMRVRDLGKGMSGTLHIALSSEQQMPEWLMERIKAFLSAHPAVELHFSRMNISAIRMALMEETVDLAVCLDFRWISDEGNNSTLLLREERPCLVRSSTARENHGAPMVTPDECVHILKNTKLLFPSSPYLGAGTKDPVEPLRAMFHLPEFTPMVRFVQDPDAVSLYVAAGMGVTITNRTNTIALEKNVDLLEILWAEPFRKVLEYRTESKNPVLPSFLEFVRQELRRNTDAEGI